MINGYTFSKLSTYSKSWICSNRISYQCEAKIKMQGLERVIESHLDHNHPPPKYYVTQEGKYIVHVCINLTCFTSFSGIQFKMINTNKKGYLIMINKYTFSRVNKESSIWVCSRKRSHECKAKVKMEESGSITPYCLEHNHEPPSYHITSDGTYVKV
ncbi:hypothetical protein ABMA27_001344 [Loxostege sticticalis]|uniref:FLYWCH-type domain-containing protein n=1 Tax=Loxostege sticticalis TaxID=481309 RepID=A0ABR3HYE8_LOXSC